MRSLVPPPCGARWLAAMVFAAFASGLPATQFVPMSIQELTDRSQLVVLGTVQDKSCQRDEAGRIYTRVNLKVAEVWKGNVAGDLLPVVQGGGVLGRRKVVVVGQVDYRIGEEVVAFLVRNPRGEAVTLGLCQGKFHVSTDAVSRQKRVRNPFHGGDDGLRPGEQPEAAAAAGGPLTLAALKRQVQGGKQ